MLSLSHPGSVSSRLIVPFLVRESGHKGNLHQSSSFLRQDFASYLWSELKFQSLQNISWELLLYFATKYSDVVCLIYMGESYVEKFLHFVWWCRAEIMITASYKRGERWRGKGLTQILNNIVLFKWIYSLFWCLKKWFMEMLLCCGFDGYPGGEWGIEHLMVLINKCAHAWMIKKRSNLVWF